jgi:CRP-like cAMP-binding protein
MNCTDCPNKECFLNKFCISEWLEYSQHHKTSKYISAAKTIFTEGDLVEGIYIICNGKAKVTSKNSKEKESIIRIAGSGQVLGHRGFSEKMVYPISADTLIESEIAYLSNDDFFKLIRANKDLAFHLMMFFADELLRSEHRFRTQNLNSSKAKVASALLMVIEAFGYKDDTTKHIDMGMSLRELAIFATISYPTLSRTLTTFTQDGVIGNIKNEFCLLDESALKELAGEDY